MAEMLLRDAVEQTRALVNAGRYADALALGQHILRYYPKDLHVYALLAEAHLELNDFDAASDLFQRVRSVDPENILALMGLSIIYEHEQKLDEAIWHLERAYEIQPSSDELRNALLRLYSAQEGTPRPRLKYTPGSLARMYAREGLYPQAIQEFRALLRRDPARLDLQAALAETLYRAGQKPEAVRLAQALLEKLPFCLKANLVVGAVWAESGIADAETFLQRARALDPEQTLAHELGINGASALDGETNIGLPHAPTLPAPDLAFTAAPTPAQDLPPDAAPTTNETAAPPPADLPDWLALPEIETPASRVTEHSAEPDVPTWLSEMLDSAAPVAPSAPVELPAAETIVPTLAREPAAEPTPTAPQPTAAQVLETAPTTHLTPALPTVAPTIVGALDKLPEWIRGELETNAPAPTIEPMPFSAPSIEPAAQETTAPAPEPPAQDRAPDWMTRMREVARRGELEDAAPTEAAAEAQIEQVESEPLPDAAVTEWLHAPVSETLPTPEASMPEWLSAAADNAAPEKASRAVSEMPESLSTSAESTPAAETQTRDAALPEWLSASAPPSAASETPSAPPDWLSAPAADVVESTSDVDLPDWLRDLPPLPEVETTAPAADSSAPIAETSAPTADSSAAESRAPIAESRAVETSTPVAEVNATMQNDVPVDSATVSTAPKKDDVGTGAAPTVEPADTKERPSFDAESLLLQARAYREENQSAAALEAYERVLQRAPRYTNQVIADLEEYVKEPEAPEPAIRLLGDAYAMAGRFKEALEQYRRILGNRS